MLKHDLPLKHKEESTLVISNLYGPTRP